MQRVSWLSRDSEASLYLLWQKSIMLSVNCSSQRRWTNAGDKGSHHSVWKPLHIWTSAIIRKGFFSFSFLSLVFFWVGGGVERKVRVGCEREKTYFSSNVDWGLRFCELSKYVALAGGGGMGLRQFSEILVISGWLYILIIHSDLPI